MMLNGIRSIDQRNWNRDCDEGRIIAAVSFFQQAPAAILNGMSNLLARDFLGHFNPAAATVTLKESASLPDRFDNFNGDCPLVNWRLRLKVAIAVGLYESCGDDDEGMSRSL